MDDIERRVRRALDRGEARVFQFFWLFLPEPRIARHFRFQHVLASRFLSDAAQQSLTYSAIVAVVRNGGSSLDAALLGAAGLIPPAVLGLYGGVVSDAVPKRVALGLSYLCQALLCFTIPVFFGTNLSAMIFLLLMVGAFGQVSGPAESSVVPLVASNEQLASANAMLSFASAAGTAFGTALLAPLLVRLYGVQTVIYVAGGLLLLASSRVFHLRTRQELQKMTWETPRVRLSSSLAWLMEHPSVTTMILVGVLAGTASIVLQTLTPRYVQSALHVDAANSVYVFAPSAAGMLLGLALTPKLVRLLGERVVALVGFLLIASSLVLLGGIDGVSVVIGPVNPLRLLALVAVDLNDDVYTAALLAVPIGLGTTLTATSVQTYINRRVPLTFQGRTFAMQGMLKNTTAIVPLLTFGAVAAEVGVKPVLLAAPFLLLLAAYSLILVSFRFTRRRVPTGGEVFASFWQEPDETATRPAPQELEPTAGPV